MKLHKVINFLRFPNINPQTKNKPLKFHKTFSQSKSHHHHKTPNDSDKETFDTTLRRGHNLDIHIPDKQRIEWSYSLHAPSPPKQSERSTRQNAGHRSQHLKADSVCLQFSPPRWSSRTTMPNRGSGFLRTKPRWNRDGASPTTPCISTTRQKKDKTE